MGAMSDAEDAGGQDDGLAALARCWTLQPSDRGGGRIAAFENFDRFAELMTQERHRILRHLHDHPEPCVSALADVLDRPFRLVHEDVMVLELAGLIERSDGKLNVTADRFSVMIAL